MVWSRRLILMLFASLAWQQATAETVLLDFMSPACGPCRAMQPVLRQLAAAGYDIREIDSSRDPGAGVAAQYRVTELPTFVVLVDGQERDRLVGGGNSAAKLVEMIHTATKIAAAAKGGNQTGAPSFFTDDGAAEVAANAASTNTFQPGRVVPITADPPVSRSAPRTQPAASTNTDALIAATVRLSIEDPDGKSTGTGTIVDAREGKALVLTCGHLFRSSNGKGAIEIALFTPGPDGAELRTTAEGTLIDYDLDRDLALVCFAPDAQVAVAPVARSADAMQVGHAATSVGCENGANPTPWATQITAIDRYQGTPNIEAARAPVEGRSGGGLFNAAGELVGVCNAADPQLDEGLYASLPSIHAKLDALKLAFVYQTPAGGGARTPESGVTQLAATELPFEVRGQNPTPEAPSESPAEPPATPLSLAAPATALTPQDQAILEEITRRGADSEVICIIRPREAGGRSEVIKLDRASPALVRALGGGAQPAEAGSTSAAAPASAGQPLVR